jgi:hypothetical protein
MAMTGRKPKLTAQQAAELRRYMTARKANPDAHRDVTDFWLSQHFGIAESTLYIYAQGRVKRYAQETRHE